MSNYFSAVINNEYFYLLPICNLKPTSSSDVLGNVSGTNPLATSITIPDYIKKLDTDYISFGSSPASNTQLPSLVTVCQIVYDTGAGSFQVVNSAGSLVNLATPSEYIVEIRVPTCELLPIDIKSIKRIQASASSADTNRVAAPTNITLWKRFLKSDATNKNQYMVDGKLPVGPNPTV